MGVKKITGVAKKKTTGNKVLYIIAYTGYMYHKCKLREYIYEVTRITSRRNQFTLMGANGRVLKIVRSLIIHT